MVARKETVSLEEEVEIRFGLVLVGSEEVDESVKMETVKFWDGWRFLPSQSCVGHR